MASVEEIRQNIQRRLEELLEEADRLRAAIRVLGADNPETGRARPARPAPRPALQTFTNRRMPPASANNQREPIKPKRAAVIPPTADGHAGYGEHSAPATPRDRVLSQLRRELAAGLRNT